MTLYDKDSRLIVLFKINIHCKWLKRCFRHQVVKRYFPFLFPFHIAVCVDCRIAQYGFAKGIERIFNMLFELFRISHIHSPPFFPVGGYYNKRPCNKKLHERLNDMRYKSIRKELTVHIYGRNMPLYRLGFF